MYVFRISQTVSEIWGLKVQKKFFFSKFYFSKFFKNFLFSIRFMIYWFIFCKKNFLKNFMTKIFHPSQNRWKWKKLDFFTIHSDRKLNFPHLIIPSHFLISITVSEIIWGQSQNFEKWENFFFQFFSIFAQNLP